MNGLSQDLEAPGEGQAGAGSPDAGAEARTMESPVFGARPARFIFSMRAGGERRECEAGFPQPPPRRSASPAPGPHSPLATAEPQERCCQAGCCGGALWLWRLGEMPQSQPASQTRPERQVHTSDLPSTPQPAALLIQRASGSQEISRGALGVARDAVQSPARPHHSLAQRLLTLTSHTVLTRLVSVAQAQGRPEAAPAGEVAPE